MLSILQNDGLLEIGMHFKTKYQSLFNFCPLFNKLFLQSFFFPDYKYSSFRKSIICVCKFIYLCPYIYQYLYIDHIFLFRNTFTVTNLSLLCMVFGNSYSHLDSHSVVSITLKKRTLTECVVNECITLLKL